MQLHMFLLSCTLHFYFGEVEGDKRTVAVVHGDFVIGVLLPIHYPPESNKKRLSQNNIQCGSIREDYGIQRIEAVFHTIDVINSDPDW
ncbi:hypothetical protein QE152_g8134 [Popillia japonica]|uniref:Uncharacterized protein n=1 Tax=Popillia japonica TaxID=7064 RepID=A0AAW1MBW9_POPJA